MKAQRLGLGKMAHDGLSTSAGTTIDPKIHGISASTAKFTDHARPEFHEVRNLDVQKATGGALCQGCSQPMVTEFIATQRNERTNPL